MEVNEALRDQVYIILENQLKENTPPEVRETHERLLKLGHPEDDVKQLIGQCIALEIFNVMKYKEPYNNERYVKNVLALPKSPFD